MPNGFFPASDSIARKRQPLLIPRCNSCGLYRKCKSGKMKVFGGGKRGILIVGEAPGKDEDFHGIPFVGKSGIKLRDTLREFDVDMDRDCWRTNALICWPWVESKGQKRNRSPLDKEVNFCRPNLVNAIKELKPSTIILLGKFAVHSLMGWLWRENDIGKIGKWIGWKIPCQSLNCWICPAWHPSFLLRASGDSDLEGEEYDGGEGWSGKDRRAGNEVRELLWKRAIQAACELQGRPWKEVPDWKKHVQVVLSPDGAAVWLDTLRKRNVPLALDYETNMKKPDSDKARIVSCAVSDGNTSISYPWHGKAIQATEQLLLSDTPLIGYNLKFENRFSHAILGVVPKNWVWDGMMAAHVLDSRPGITGLKFQAFALLGQEAWNEQVEPFLKSNDEGGNSENRIGEVRPETLLLYGGLDALLEWKVAQVQMKQMGLNINEICSIPNR